MKTKVHVIEKYQDVKTVLFIHHFTTEIEANAYILGIKEMLSRDINRENIIIKTNGREKDSHQ